MKKLSIVLFVVVAFSCTKSKENYNSNFVGKWKLTEALIGDGVSTPYWTKVSDGKVYEFLENETFTDTKIVSSQTNCKENSYTFVNDLLTLNYFCNNKMEIQIFKVKKEENSIILTPQHIRCSEGCDYKYEKIE